MRSIFLLHLSDLHFSEHNQQAKEFVVTKLLDRLKQQLPTYGIKRPDLILVTGDLTRSGTPEQFDLFRDAMTELTRGLGMRLSQIHVCCGNHDFDRNTIKEFETIYDGFVDKAVKHDEQFFMNVFGNPSPGAVEKNLLLKGTENFRVGTSTYNDNESRTDSLHTVTTLRPKGKSMPQLIIASFNSCFLNFPDSGSVGSKKGFISKWQMNQVASKIENRTDAIRIALYHQPIQSLLDNDDRTDAEDFFKRNFDIGLHGHLHSERSSQRYASGEESFLEIGAGAMLTRGRKIISYSLIRIDIDRGVVDVFPSRFDLEGMDWDAQVKPETFEFSWALRQNAKVLSEIRTWSTKAEKELRQRTFLYEGPKPPETRKKLGAELFYGKYKVVLGRETLDINNVIALTLGAMNESPLLLLGHAGAGKSTILSSIYFKYKTSLTSYEQYEIIPSTSVLFIDLSDYEDTKRILELISRVPEGQNSRFELFLDGFDEYLSNLDTDTTGKLDIVEKVLANASKNVKVVALATRTNTYSQYPDRVLSIIEKPRTIELLELVLDEDELRKFIVGYVTELESLDHQVVDTVVRNTVYNLRTSQLPRLPLFLIMLAYVNFRRYKTGEEERSVPTEFELYYELTKAIYERYSKEIATSFLEYIESLSEIAWVHYVKQQFGSIKPEDSELSKFVVRLDNFALYQTSKNRYAPFVRSEKHREGGIRYRFVHDTFLRFFTAVYLGSVLASRGSNEEAIRSVFAFPPTKDVARFSREYVHQLVDLDKSPYRPSEYLTGREIVERMISTYRSLADSSSVFAGNARQGMIYYLGRVNSDVAREFLSELYTRMKVSIRSRPELKNNLEWRIAFRSVAVDLMKQGNPEVEKDYFEKLELDKVEFELNLAYHLEYYFDVSPSEWMQKPHEFRNVPFTRTFESLRGTITNFLKTGGEKTYINLPVFTLISLISRRLDQGGNFTREVLTPASFLYLALQAMKNDSAKYQVNGQILEKNYYLLEGLIRGRLSEPQKIVLLERINEQKKLLAADNAWDSKLESGLEEGLRDVMGGETYQTGRKILQILDLYKLKDLKRTGWRMSGIRDSESVSDHIFSAMLIGYLLEKGEISDSQLNELLKMLLFHDLPESKTGDLVPGQIEIEEKIANERLAMERIALALNDGSPKEYFERYVESKVQASKLANELDKLDAIFQALVYSERGTFGNELKRFFDRIDELHVIKSENLLRVYLLLRAMFQLRDYPDRISSTERTPSQEEYKFGSTYGDVESW